MSRMLTIITLLLVVIAGLALYARNSDPVVVDYYLRQFEAPLFLIVVGALFVGAVLGLLACLPLIVKLRFKNADLRKTIRLKERELTKIRVPPSKEVQEKAPSLDDNR